DHSAKVSDVELRKIFINSFYFESKARREVFLVPEHHVDQWRQFAINCLRARLPADTFPQGLAIVQIVRNDRSMFLRDFNSLARDRGRCFRQRTKNASRVKPARA